MVKPRTLAVLRLMTSSNCVCIAQVEGSSGGGVCRWRGRRALGRIESAGRVRRRGSAHLSRARPFGRWTQGCRFVEGQWARATNLAIFGEDLGERGNVVRASVDRFH